MRILTLLVGGLLSLPHPALAQEPQPLDLEKVPREGQAAQDFVPAGWKVEETIKGDLDKNNSEDVVLQLIAQGSAPKEGEEADRARALLVLLSEGGKLRRAGASNKVLYCSTCAGTLSAGEGGGQVKIQKGVIIVDQVSGSRDTTHTTLRFRYDAKDKRFVFIGEDVDLRDRLTGHTEKTSTNLLTGQKISESLQYDEKTDKDVVASSKKQKVAVTRRFLEDVDIGTY